jgi:hypothetical protein
MMTPWRFILLECGVLGAASFALVGAQKFGAARAEAWESARAVAAAPAAAAAAIAADDPLAPAPVQVARTPAGTFLGVRDELLLAPLRTEDVREVKFNHGGSSISLRVTFVDGSRAAFKPLQNNPQTVPRKEIAAYRLNRLLGLNAVPPAAPRTLHREDLFGKLVPESRAYLKRLNKETIFDGEGFTRGEVSWWIPVIVNPRLDDEATIDQWTRWLTVGEEIPAAKRRLMAQLSTLLVFDLLQNNSDRFSGGNLLTSPDGQILFYMDNTFGFQVEPQGHVKCREMLAHAQKFSRSLVAALRRLDARAVRDSFAPDPIELTDAEIDSVVARRDVALRYIDGLIARNGESRVLVFP